MKTYFILLSVILFICIILFLIMKKDKEGFKPIIYELPKNYTYDTSGNIDNQLVVSKDDPNNNFPPLDLNAPKVEAPVVVFREAQPDEVFKDNKYIREPGVEKAMEARNESNENIFINYVDAIPNYNIPINSNDEISFKKYSDFTQDELKDTYIANIHDMMVGKVTKTLSQDEYNMVAGQPISDDNIPNLYKPVYTAIDNELGINNIDDINYKYQAYEKLPFGSAKY